MPFQKQRTMLIAKDSFVGLLDGSPFEVFEGRTRIWSDHPAARRWPHAFALIEVTDEAVVTEVRADLADAIVEPGGGA